jgi:dimeric dUTPase (all-alpha-NTP-PPase superfamily)
MDIEIRTYSTLCEITVESDNTKITESLTFLNRETKQYEADSNIAEQLITAAFDISRFNKKSDVDMVKEIFENFLNKHEFIVPKVCVSGVLIN